MFDNKEIEAYRSISAPADLRNRVLSFDTEERKPARNTARMIRRVSTLAACLVLMICFSAMAITSMGAVGISVSGDALEKNETMTVLENGVAPLSYDKRSLSQVEIPMTLAIEHETAITVSGGALCIVEEETDEIRETVLSGTVYRTDSPESLIWTVSADAEQKEFEMTLKSRFKTETITLAFDEHTGAWVISRRK